MSKRVGIYSGHPTEPRPDMLLVDLGIDPSPEVLMSAAREAPAESWLMLVPAEGGTATCVPVPDLPDEATLLYV